MPLIFLQAKFYFSNAADTFLRH